MAISKEDYYNTPNAELGDKNDKVVASETATDEVEVDEVDTESEVDGDLDEDVVEKLKNVEVPKTTEAAKETPKTEEASEAEEFEIEVEDDSPLTDDDINEVVKLAEAKGLTKAETQEELARREAYLKRGLSASEHKANEAIAQFEAERRAHPLFATHEVEKESMRAVNTALDKFFDKGFRDRFDKVYSKDVHLLTALHRLGKQFLPSKMDGNPIGGFENVKEGGNAEERRMRALYPENF